MTAPLPPTSQTLWVDEWTSRYPPLNGERKVDVVVVGAGIAGLTTAVLLARAGVSVAVLEGSMISSGTTGHTTAKISVLQGLRLQQIQERHGTEAASRYVAAQQAGLDWMATRVAERRVECGFERRPAFTYTTDPARQAAVAREVKVGRSLGLDTSFATTTELPFEVAAAVTLPDQAQFDPHPYLLDLADEVASTPGCSVHEHSRVVGFDHLNKRGVTTAAGHVQAATVIVTTLLPVTDQGLFFARAEAKQSYLIAAAVDGERPQGMYLSADEPTRSVRSADHDGEALLLIGGGGHVVGRRRDTLGEYEALRQFAVEHFEVTAVRRRWSAHDYSSIDLLPFVGPCWSPFGRIMVATGFSKWGMTNGTAAALALADRVLGRRDGPAAKWAGLFDPARIGFGALVSAGKINGNVATRMVRDWLTTGGTQQPGTGSVPGAPAAVSGAGGGHRPEVGRQGPRPVAKVQVDGAECELSLVCPHLHGVLQWNEADRTWDCPLHGSRFGETGEVRFGPAVTPMRRIDESPVPRPVAVKPAESTSGSLEGPQEDGIALARLGAVVRHHDTLGLTARAGQGQHGEHVGGVGRPFEAPHAGQRHAARIGLGATARAPHLALRRDGHVLPPAVGGQLLQHRDQGRVVAGHPVGGPVGPLLRFLASHHPAHRTPAHPGPFSTHPPPEPGGHRHRCTGYIRFRTPPGPPSGWPGEPPTPRTHRDRPGTGTPPFLALVAAH